MEQVYTGPQPGTKECVNIKTLQFMDVQMIVFFHSMHWLQRVFFVNLVYKS